MFRFVFLPLRIDIICLSAWADGSLPPARTERPWHFKPTLYFEDRHDASPRPPPSFRSACSPLCGNSVALHTPLGRYAGRSGQRLSRRGRLFCTSSSKPTGGWETVTERKGNKTTTGRRCRGTRSAVTPRLQSMPFWPAARIHRTRGSQRRSSSSRRPTSSAFMRSGLRCQVWLLIPQTAQVKSKVEQDKQLLHRRSE